MNLGPATLLIYAVLMLVGGFMGYARAGSKVSLIAGVASGILLLVSWIVTRSHLVAGLWMGAGITLLLCVSFAMRLAKTGKFMPSGGLLLVSVVALLVLAYSAYSTGKA